MGSKYLMVTSLILGFQLASCRQPSSAARVKDASSSIVSLTISTTNGITSYRSQTNDPSSSKIVDVSITAVLTGFNRVSSEIYDSQGMTAGKLFFSVKGTRRTDGSTANGNATCVNSKADFVDASVSLQCDAGDRSPLTPGTNGINPGNSSSGKYPDGLSQDKYQLFDRLVTQCGTGGASGDLLVRMDSNLENARGCYCANSDVQVMFMDIIDQPDPVQSLRDRCARASITTTSLTNQMAARCVSELPQSSRATTTNINKCQCVLKSGGTEDVFYKTYFSVYNPVPAFVSDLRSICGLPNQ